MQAPCASLSGRLSATTKAVATKATIRNVSRALTLFRPREMLKKSPLQSKATKGVISRENCSLPPAKRPLIFNRSEPVLSIVSTRTETNFPGTERFVGRYRGISTRTQLEVLPRNLCPLINEHESVRSCYSPSIFHAPQCNLTRPPSVV